jgi:uncharacterized protein YqgV (UPF0045/DUF77 family)
MNVKLEISMYPLTPDYEEPILNFINQLKSNKNLVVEVNSMSTQISGEITEVMKAYTDAAKITFSENQTTVFVSKLLHIK